MDAATALEIGRKTMKVADKIINYVKADNEKTFGLDEAVRVQLEGVDPIPGRNGTLFIVDCVTKDGSLEVHLTQGESFTRIDLTAHPFPASAHLWNGPDLLKKTKYRSMLASLFHDLIWSHRKELSEALGITIPEVLDWGNGVLYGVWMHASGKSFVGRIEARLAWQVCDYSKGWYHQAKEMLGLNSLILALLLVVGCGTPPDWRVTEIEGTNAVLRAMGKEQRVEVVSPATTGTPTATTKDEVDFALLDFCWGAFKGGSAKLVDGVEIGSLKVSGSGMSYKWKTGGCEKLGASSSTDAACLACLFCKLDGRWRGGKFDWISTSRTTRGFENISDGYNGWQKDAVSKAAEYAFVIVSSDGKKRSNVIKAAR